MSAEGFPHRGLTQGLGQGPALHGPAPGSASVPLCSIECLKTPLPCAQV